MTTIYLDGKSINIDEANDIIGSGGEADVYKVSNHHVVKLFKKPDHSTLIGFPEDQKAAAERIRVHQTKLKDYPKGNLPTGVIVPEKLVTDKSGTIIGYSMPLIENIEVLKKYGDMSYRQNGISNDIISPIYGILHQNVEALHNVNVCIGDFNDLNVLVSNNHDQVYMIDTDSYQFGKYICGVFTEKFVDPTLCSLASRGGQTIMQLAHQHNNNSDWYAFAVMFFRSLLCVGPYDGIYNPKDKSKKIPHPHRPMYRITVFNPDVRYPKDTPHYSLLPDDLLQYFHEILEKDSRGVFPKNLLDITWQKCYNCSTIHARRVCPVCATPGAVKETLTIKGSVTARTIFKTDGTIICAAINNGLLNYLYNDGSYKRENNQVVISGVLNPSIRYRISNYDTYLGQGNSLVNVNSSGVERMYVDTFGNLPMYDTNSKGKYWVSHGSLYREGVFKIQQKICDVSTSNTMFWTGEDFGLGFYRTGPINVYFMFETDGSSINDRINLPIVPGQILDSTCVFGKDICWFFISYRANGKEINKCSVVDRNGVVLAISETDAGDGSWLGSIRGKTAFMKNLLVATDYGIIRMAIDNGNIIEEAKFPDTEPFVSSASQLFAGRDGLYVVGQKDIKLLIIR